MFSWRRSNNNNNTSNHGRNGRNGRNDRNSGGYIQSQEYCNEKDQQLEQVKTRVFVEQLDGIIETLDTVLDMVQNGKAYNDTKINLMTDMLIKSCNYFARNCHSYQQKGYKKALKLAQKKVHDHWETLDSDTFNNTINYRNFLMKAIQSKNLQQMNKRRVKTSSEQEIHENASKDTNELNKAWSTVIYHKAHFDEQIEQYQKNPNEREHEYEQQLAEFEKNKKYHQNDIPLNVGHESGLYFTNSGKSAQFVYNQQVNKEIDEKLNAEIMGGNDNMDNNNNNKNEYYNFMNAMIIASPSNKLGPISYPIPCKLTTNPPLSGKVKVLLPAPFYKAQGFQIDVEKYEIVRHEVDVEKCENQYMKDKGIKSLGPDYPSIVEQHQSIMNQMCDEEGDFNVN